VQVTGALYSEETQNGEIMEAGVRLAGLHEIPNSRTHLKGSQAAAVRENLDDGAIVKVRASAAVRAGLSVHGAGTQPCDEEGGALQQGCCLEWRHCGGGGRRRHRANRQVAR